LRVLAELGPSTAGWMVLGSLRQALRARAEADRLAVPPPDSGQGPGALEELTEEADAVVARFARATLTLAFLAPDCLLLEWRRRAAPEDPPPSLLAGDRARERVTPTRHPSAEGVLELDAGGPLRVRLGADGTLVVLDGAGEVVRVDEPPCWREAGWSARWACPPGALVTGLGLQAGPLDRRGRRYRLWNLDPGGSWGPDAGPLYCNVPVLLAVDGARSLLDVLDTSEALEVDLRSPGSGWVGAPAGPLRRVLALGRPPLLLERLAELTGPPALPPRWALGYQHSRWGFRSAATVAGIRAGFAACGLPVSAIHLDIDHLAGYRVLTADPQRFGDLPGLVGSLGALGTRVVTIVDPGVKVDRGFGLFRRGSAGDHFCRTPRGRLAIGVVWPGRAAFPDFADPAVRDWWAEEVAARLRASGVGGLWHDMNEPTSLAIGVEPRLPLATRHRVDRQVHDHAALRNRYANGMNEAGFEGSRLARPEARPFVLSRSGWLGGQRHAWHWTGDAETSWAGLRQQVAAVLGLGLSGFPFTGSDVGGFTADPDPELYLRWLQFAAFVPLLRTHAMIGLRPREPWRWPEPFGRAVASWIRFRYRLLPLLLGLAHEAAEQGAPLVRPLWWPDGEAVAVLGDDAFLLGDDLLVAPVYAPGARRRALRLPAGRWVGAWAGSSPTALAGRTVVQLGAPLERLPLLVRAGRILVLDDAWAEPGGACQLEGDEALRADEDPAWNRGTPDLAHTPGCWGLHCWPAEDPEGQAAGAEGRALDEAGDGHGPVRLDRYRLSGVAEGGTATLAWERTGTFPPPASVRVVVHGWAVERALADGRPAAVEGGTVRCGPFDELVLVGLRRRAAAPSPAYHLD
jgi:alpha-glucosidase